MSVKDLMFTKEHEWVKVDGDTATIAVLGWVASAVLFFVISRSKDALMHGAVVALAWVWLLAEYVLEIQRGVPSL